MDSATASEHIFMLLEVLSRYSVPAFFFISGYGLFYTYALDKPFAYWSFIKKRLTSIGVPYVIWSLLYSAVYSFAYHAPQLIQSSALTSALPSAIYSAPTGQMLKQVSQPIQLSLSIVTDIYSHLIWQLSLPLIVFRPICQLPLVDLPH